MLVKVKMRWALVLVACVGVAGAALGKEPKTLTPTTIELKSTPYGEGWKRWEGIGNIEGAVNERITALVANGSDVWVGTCFGRLLTHQNDGWILQGRLDGTQITGIAVEGADKVWLSTSDGIRRLCIGSLRRQTMGDSCA